MTEATSWSSDVGKRRAGRPDVSFADQLMQCAQACTECAQACLAAVDSTRHIECIWAATWCADLCRATARQLPGLDPPKESEAGLLLTCLEACQAAARECEAPPALAVCGECVQACRLAAAACLALLELPAGGRSEPIR